METEEQSRNVRRFWVTADESSFKLTLTFYDTTQYVCAYIVIERQ